MIQRIVNISEKMSPLLSLLAAIFVIALILFEGWMLVLRKPFVEYKKISATRTTLAATVKGSPDQSGELIRLASELKQLSEQLSGELRLPASDDKMAASLMESLDHTATAHHISLAGVKPLERKQVSVFEEVSFDVSAKGSYLDLCAWMLDFGKTLGNNATITEFDMKTADEGKQVMLSMKIALYRPLKLSEVSGGA